MHRAFVLCALAAAAAFAQNAGDLLERAAALMPTAPAEAVKLLQQALRLDPDLPGLRFQLGLAYHAIGDEADAAAELRTVVARTPASAGAHNYLGIVLFQSGDAAAALAEFRAAARLAPTDANAHFNLGESMARTGDSAGAVAELRIASQLQPSDAGLARLLTAVETRLAPGGAIKVEVRQVLVPVVVTDPEGHHINGLTRSDFKLFEDGVEQKITAFSVEHSGAPEVGAPSPLSPVPSQPPPSAPHTPRRTYMILIDTLHTSFHNLNSARDALVTLFRQEHSADSQYVVIALGISPEMILNVTRNPAAVLAALSAKSLQKIFADGALGGPNADMERFRRDLSDTRAVCDVAASDTVAKTRCAAGLQRLSSQSQNISELESTVTAEYLRQFRSLVNQLAPARDRRTIVLISDGFSIEPGREAETLRTAYFPPASHCMVPADVYCPTAAGSRATNRMSADLEPILKLASAANITIHTIDSRGLSGQREFDASSPGSTSGMSNSIGLITRAADAARGNTLREVADATGGTAFHDSNNLFLGLERAFADGRDYYTLAYVSTNHDYDGKFRAIAVQVRGKDVVVNAKRGYWAAPSAQ